MKRSNIQHIFCLRQARLRFG